jgi:hypothetical protein
MLVIRGANSDILSAATVEAMAAHHSGMQSIEVPDQGHVPALEGGLIATVAQFVAACDGARLRVNRSCSKKNPRRKVRRGSSNSYLDQAIRAGSRGERER